MAGKISYCQKLPGSETRRGADSQQAHPIDLFADKFFNLVHKLARLLSVNKLEESTMRGRRSQEKLGSSRGEAFAARFLAKKVLILQMLRP